MTGRLTIAHFLEHGPDPKEPVKRRKGCYVGAPNCFELELAIRLVQDAFDCGCYVVGSALERPDRRDVDVVAILSDEAFAQLFPNASGHSYEFDARWLLLTVALSKWLGEKTGLPIDFKFQPQTLANARHHGPRNAVGMRISKEK